MQERYQLDVKVGAMSSPPCYAYAYVVSLAAGGSCVSSIAEIDGFAVNGMSVARVCMTFSLKLTNETACAGQGHALRKLEHTDGRACRRRANGHRYQLRRLARTTAVLTGDAGHALRSYGAYQELHSWANPS